MNDISKIKKHLTETRTLLNIGVPPKFQEQTEESLLENFNAFVCVAEMIYYLQVKLDSLLKNYDQEKEKNTKEILKEKIEWYYTVYMRVTESMIILKKLTFLPKEGTKSV